VTPPPLDFPAPVAEDLLGEDWFGEGTAFDTGEDLANALMVLAGGRMEWPVAAPSQPPGPVPTDSRPERLGPSPAPLRPLPGVTPRPEPIAEFQVASMPSSHPGGEPSGWGPRAPAVTRRRWSGGVGPERRGWSIRQSVQLLRVTEQIMARLREEAAQLTWQLAAAAHRETDASS
jgi:hypothetical protein